MDYRQQYAQYLQRAEDALQAAADCLAGQSRVAEADVYKRQPYRRWAVGWQWWTSGVNWPLGRRNFP